MLAAVEVYRPAGRAPVLLLCDHAGRLIPNDLGVAEADRRRPYRPVQKGNRGAD